MEAPGKVLGPRTALQALRRSAGRKTDGPYSRRSAGLQPRAARSPGNSATATSRSECTAFVFVSRYHQRRWSRGGAGSLLVARCLILSPEIATAAHVRSRGGGTSLRKTGWPYQAGALRERDQEIATLRMRCECPIVRICLAEGNAQEFGIDPVETLEALPSPDRPVSHAGTWRSGRR